MREEIRKELEKNAETEYCKFVAGLLPGEQKILGVRLPILRQIGKKLGNEGWKAYIEEGSAHKKSSDHYMEETMLEGMAIGYGKMSLEERFFYLDQWVPKIVNWSVCDSCCMTCHFMKQDQKQWWDHLMVWLHGKEEFSVRFATVGLLSYFVNDDYVDQVLGELGQIKLEFYYVKMAVAWAVSVCFVKYPEKTFEFLKQNKLDEWTQKKAIQKIRESYRVSKEWKEKVRAWIL